MTSFIVSQLTRSIARGEGGREGGGGGVHNVMPESAAAALTNGQTD